MRSRVPLPGAHEVYRHFRDVLQALPLPVGSSGWKRFIKEAAEERRAIAERVAHGRDRLLELHSYRADQAGHWVEAIRAVDESPELESLLMALFEVHGIHPEALGDRGWLLKPDALFTVDFPGFPKEGMTITLDRRRALEREDVAFISWDHPLVQGAVDRVVSGAEGNSSVAMWRKEVGTQFLVEAVFVLEVIVTETDAARYLPATPIHLWLDDRGDVWKGAFPQEEELTDLTSVGEEEREQFRSQLPKIMARAEEHAGAQAGPLRSVARQALEKAETLELRRLKTLQTKTGHVSDDELEQRAARLVRSLDEIGRAPLRLDALRWIWCINPSSPESLC